MIITQNILAFEVDEHNSRLIGRGKNLITDAGRRFYAIRGAQEQVPDNLFVNGDGGLFDGVIVIANGATPTPTIGDLYSVLQGVIANSTMMSGYPKINDPDDDNTLITQTNNVTITYTATFAAAVVGGVTGIANVAITNPGVVPSDPLLMHGELSPAVNVTAGKGLKVIVNHRVLGSQVDTPYEQGFA